MHPVFQCCFCLDNIEKERITVGHDKCSDYKDIIECSKELLNDQIERDFSLRTSLETWSMSLCTKCFKSSEEIYKLNKQLTELEKTLKSLIAEFVTEINFRVSNNAGEMYILENQVKVEAEEDLSIIDENSSTGCDEVDFENETFPCKDEFNDDPLTSGPHIEDNSDGTSEYDDPLKPDNDDETSSAKDEQNILNPSLVLSNKKNGDKFLDQNALTEPAILGKRKAAILASAKMKKIASENAHMSEDYTFPAEIMHEKLHNNKGFLCRHCKKVFRSEEDFIRHQSVCKPGHGKVFQCNVCEKQFFSGSTLKNHVLLHKTELKCSTCGKVCKNIIALKSHQLIHKTKTHVCEMCGVKATTSFKLKEHIKIVHQRIREHKCSTCGKEFGNRVNLLSHQETHKTDSERKKYDCNICSGICLTAKALRLHKGEFHTAYTTGFIYCDKCECKFINGREMVTHSRKSSGHTLVDCHRRHRGPKCKFCKENFIIRCDLLLHLARYHPTERNPYKCETCHAVFRADTLKEHTPNCKKLGGSDFNSLSDNDEPSKKLSSIKIHKIEKPFVCKNCGENFISKKCLKDHYLKNHEHPRRNEKSFSCSTCGKSFTQSFKLTKHLKTHSTERSYPCSTCGKSFTQSTNLKKHLKIHSAEKPFSCSTCGKSFFMKRDLVRHEKVHTGEKAYLCDTCGKSFTQSASLRTHERIHSGEKPYSCSICGKSFSDNSTWSKHKKTHNQ